MGSLELTPRESYFKVFQIHSRRAQLPESVFQMQDSSASKSLKIISSRDVLLILLGEMNMQERQHFKQYIKALHVLNKEGCGHEDEG